jgi:hypothetical protein
MSKNKNIKEQIDYGDYPERIHPSIQKKLERGETPYSQHQAMPEGEKNFDQIVASKRFKDVVDKFAHYAGTREPLRGANPMMSLMSIAMSMVQKITSIERANKTYLEKLAVDLVMKQMGIPKGKINYIAKLVPYGQVSSEQPMLGQEEEFSDEEIEQAFKEKSEEIEDESEEFTDELLAFEDAFEKFNLEKAKRRFMNSLIQGASKKGHYMFELVRNELERINPELLNLYGVSQSALDYLYWIYPEEMVQAAAASGEGQAGTEEVDTQTDPPTVRAVGATFPVLVHELLKGTYEVLAAHGLPSDPRQAEMVVQSEDTLPAEIWDVRLGPVFWEKFLEAYPNELFEDDKVIIQNYLFSRFSMIDAKEFMDVAQMILSGSQEGKKYLQKMVDEIVSEIKDQEYQEAMSDDDDDDEDEDDLDDFLKGLGIHTS